MASYAFRLNGRSVSADSWDPDQPLLYVLRNQFNLHGAKFGCGLGQCGACTVLFDGRATRSCTTPVSRVAGHAITTIEGLASDSALNRIPTAFIAEQAAQCGYCTSGMIVKASELLAKNPRPSDGEIRQAMNGHLCRCGTYPRVMQAIKLAARVMAGDVP